MSDQPPGDPKVPPVRRFKSQIPWAYQPPGVAGPHRVEQPFYWDEEADVRRKSEQADPLPDWVEEQTRIVRQPAERFQSGKEAIAWFQSEYGRVLQNCSTARWWSVRVKK